MWRPWCRTAPTLQFGVGGLPVTVCSALRHHRDLELHGRVIPDAAVDLIECDAVSNACKGVDAGLTVTCGLFGTERLSRFAHENPHLVMRRATYTHAAQTLAAIERFYSINSEVEIDLSGQVNTEMAGGRYVGAVGGQVDFVRGARLSWGEGQSLRCLR